jgi:hypothetical protein
LDLGIHLRAALKDAPHLARPFGRPDRDDERGRVEGDGPILGESVRSVIAADDIITDFKRIKEEQILLKI